MTANECDGKNWRRGDRQILLNILTFLAGQGGLFTTLLTFPIFAPAMESNSWVGEPEITHP